MKNQFFYTRVELTASPITVEGQPPETIRTEFIDSFNINKVIRSYQLAEGKLFIALDDFHPERRQEPILNKNNVITGYKNVENTYQSEIVLTEAADIARFKNITEFTE